MKEISEEFKKKSLKNEIKYDEWLKISSFFSGAL
jgi:hypothetical protein